MREREGARARLCVRVRCTAAPPSPSPLAASGDGGCRCRYRASERMSDIARFRRPTCQIVFGDGGLPATSARSSSTCALLLGLLQLSGSSLLLLLLQLQLSGKKSNVRHGGGERERGERCAASTRAAVPSSQRATTIQTVHGHQVNSTQLNSNSTHATQRTVVAAPSWARVNTGRADAVMGCSHYGYRGDAKYGRRRSAATPGGLPPRLQVVSHCGSGSRESDRHRPTDAERLSRRPSPAVRSTLLERELSARGVLLSLRKSSTRSHHRGLFGQRCVTAIIQIEKDVN